MNINELEQLAKAATPGPWKLSATEYIVAAEKYIVAVDCKPKDSRYIATANPSAIRELIAAYREAVAAICNTLNGADTSRRDCRAALATAKRLGVEL